MKKPYQQVSIPMDEVMQHKELWGKWVAFKKVQGEQKVIAVSEDLDDLDDLVVGSRKYPPEASFFLVPKHPATYYVL